ncbi:MAG: HNH endonuclease [Bacteroidales bacterium]|nr:HNH endonuclease [Bacteroidales bacterium]
MDNQIRLAAFVWLKKQTEFYGDSLPRKVLEEGFDYFGRTIRLVGPQGIWKPSPMELPLSITSIMGGPYSDSVDDHGLLNYRYRGTDPMHRDNVGLREVMRHRKPLVYFFNIFPGKYLASYPVYIVNDNRSSLTFTVAVDDIAYLQADRVEDSFSGTERRSYITQTVLYRAHQRQFRERVIAAYRNQCSLCRLRHTELLDAAHIIGDREEHGDPIVQNGLSLCKIHHAAFDNNIIGINPDYQVVVRQDILEEVDGPMLKYGLQSLNNIRLILPGHKHDWPDRDRLEQRFSDFRKSV